MKPTLLCCVDVRLSALQSSEVGPNSIILTELSLDISVNVLQLFLQILY